MHTSGVPVYVCDIARRSLAGSNSLRAHHIVEVNKVVMGCNCKVFSWICDHKQNSCGKNKLKIHLE